MSISTKRVNELDTFFRDNKKYEKVKELNQYAWVNHVYSDNSELFYQIVKFWAAYELDEAAYKGLFKEELQR